MLMMEVERVVRPLFLEVMVGAKAEMVDAPKRTVATAAA